MMQLLFVGTVYCAVRPRGQDTARSNTRVRHKARGLKITDTVQCKLYNITIRKLVVYICGFISDAERKRERERQERDGEV